MKGRNQPLSSTELYKIRELGESGKISVMEIAKSVGIGTTSVKKYLHTMNIQFPGHRLRRPEIIDSEHWRCKNCNAIREVDDFLWIDSITKENRQTHCKHCVYGQTNKRLSQLESYLKHKVSALRFACSRDNLPFNISWPYIG